MTKVGNIEISNNDQISLFERLKKYQEAVNRK